MIFMMSPRGPQNRSRSKATASGTADAYLLCSTAANLRISEIVYAPNWVVSLHFPLYIFR